MSYPDNRYSHALVNYEFKIDIIEDMNKIKERGRNIERTQYEKDYNYLIDKEKNPLISKSPPLMSSKIVSFI